MGGLLSAVTGITGGLTGITGRRLLQSPPPPVTDQMLAAVTDGGNTVLHGVNGLLSTLELVSPPPARHLLQETPPPATNDAQLVNTVGAVPVQPPWHLRASDWPVAQSSPVACLLLSHLQHQPLRLPPEASSQHGCSAQLPQPSLHVDTLHLRCRPRRLSRAMWGDC